MPMITTSQHCSYFLQNLCMFCVYSFSVCKCSDEKLAKQNVFIMQIFYFLFNNN